MNAQVAMTPGKIQVLEPPPNLIAKLVKIMADVDHVEKRGTNETQRYNYVKATDVARSIRESCINHGVFVSTSVTSEERWQQQSNKGGTLNFVNVRMEFTFHDMDSGSTVGPFSSIGCGMDSGDKAIYKAMTGALKYALRNSFLIPDESDPENDDEKPEVVTQRMDSVDSNKSGSWPTKIEGDVLSCYVCSLQVSDSKFPDSKKVEVRYMGINGQETGVSCFAKGELLADLKHSEHKNAKFKLVHKQKDGKTYTNIAQVIDVQELKQREPGEDEGTF